MNRMESKENPLPVKAAVLSEWLLCAAGFPRGGQARQALFEIVPIAKLNLRNHLKKNDLPEILMAHLLPNSPGRIKYCEKEEKIAFL